MSENANSENIKVVIEIPEGSNVKYEFDEESQMMMIDRVMSTAMSYPVNYCFVPETHGEDGDPLDALLFISKSVVPGVGIKARVIGVLEMEDEEGIDHKLVVVPEKAKIDPICGAWETLNDIPAAKKAEIVHFFERYKDLEKDKWMKVRDWASKERALEILKAGQERHNNK